MPSRFSTEYVRMKAQDAEAALVAGHALRALEHLLEARSLMEESTAHLVAEARAQGASWAEVGRVFGVTRQSAWERFATPAEQTGRAIRTGCQGAPPARDVDELQEPADLEDLPQVPDDDPHLPAVQPAQPVHRPRKPPRKKRRGR